MTIKHTKDNLKPFTMSDDQIKMDNLTISNRLICYIIVQSSYFLTICMNSDSLLFLLMFISHTLAYFVLYVSNCVSGKTWK